MRKFQSINESLITKETIKGALLCIEEDLGYKMNIFHTGYAGDKIRWQTVSSDPNGSKYNAYEIRFEREIEIYSNNNIFESTILEINKIRNRLPDCIILYNFQSSHANINIFVNDKSKIILGMIIIDKSFEYNENDIKVLSKVKEQIQDMFYKGNKYKYTSRYQSNYWKGSSIILKLDLYSNIDVKKFTDDLENLKLDLKNIDGIEYQLSEREKSVTGNIGNSFAIRNYIFTITKK